MKVTLIIRLQAIVPDRQVTLLREENIGPKDSKYKGPRVLFKRLNKYLEIKISGK